MPDEIKNIQTIVAPIAKQHGVKKVSLFGSRARGDNKPDSDYDFVISKGKITGAISYMSFVYDLEDALGNRVDVITDTSDDADFLNEIKKDEIVIYEQA